MLNPNQVAIFLTNIEDFIFTREMFYSPKTYPGLEDYANNLEETIFGKLLIPKEDFDKFKHKFKLTNVQKSLLWNQKTFSYNYPNYPVYDKIMGLGRYSSNHSASKIYLYECCETLEDWENYLNRILDKLHEDENGNKSELLVWNSIECYLRRARNIVEYLKWGPAMEAWEQRNGVSFYSDWNWEDLLGKEISSWEEAFPPSETNYFVSANPNNNSEEYSSPENRENTSSNSITYSQYKDFPTNSQDRAPKDTILPPEKNLVKENSSKNSPVKLYLGGVIIFLSLLVVLATAILTKRKKSKIRL